MDRRQQSDYQQPAGYMSAQSRNSNIFRTSSVQGIDQRGHGRSTYQPYHGSMQDVSSMNIAAFPRDFRGAQDSLTTGTPLALRFSEVSSVTMQGNGNGNGHGDYPRESQIPRNEGASRTPVSVGSNYGDYRTSSNNTLFANMAPLTGDPRDLTSKEFQKAAMTALYEFLMAHGFQNVEQSGVPGKQAKSQQFSVKDLLQMSRGTLQKVFIFLMRKLLGDYKLENSAKLEDEVRGIAEKLGYPFGSSLTKNVFSSPNIPSTIPVVCGFFDWLREEVQAWLIMVSQSDEEGHGLKGLFFRPQSEDSAEWNIDSLFHNARMEFMIYAVRAHQTEDSDNEVAELFRRFDAQLEACVGNIDEKLADTREELDERVRVLQDRIENYESLDTINRNIADQDRLIAELKRETEELKAKTSKAEQEIVASDKEEKAIQLLNEASRQKIAQMEGKIKKQPMKKDDYIQQLKNEETQRGSVAQMEQETAAMKARIDLLMRDKAKFVKKLHDIVHELRDGLVEMDPNHDIDDLPYYIVDSDVDGYIVSTKNKVDQVIEGVRSRSQQAWKEGETCEFEGARMEGKKARLMEAEQKLADQERELRSKLLDLDKQKLDRKIPIAEELKGKLTAKLEAGQAALRATQEGHDVLEKKYLNKKHGQLRVQEWFQRATPADLKLRDNFIHKQQERAGHLAKLNGSLDDQVARNKQAKSVLVRGMQEALTARKHPDNVNETTRG